MPATETESQLRLSTLLLVGNANVGKSAVFFALTGRYVTVSNYPGTTIELARGSCALDEVRSVEVIDTPGTTGLTALAEDERVTCEIVRKADPTRTAVLVVVDARNLRRGLAIALEVGALGLPLVVAVNMIDEARSGGLMIDTAMLATLLGVPVVATAAPLGEGIEALRRSIPEARPALALLALGGEVSSATEWRERGTGAGERGPNETAWSGLRARAAGGPNGTGAVEHASGADLRGFAPGGAGGPEGAPAAERWLSLADSLRAKVVRDAAGDGRRPGLGRRFALGFGRAATHRVFGWPILAAVLFLSYVVVGKLGAGLTVDFLQGTVFGDAQGHGLIGLLARGFAALGPRLAAAGAPAAVLSAHAFLADLAFGHYGLFTMGLTYALALILPIVGFFFVVFGFLEDTGYLPRLAVVTNRAFSAMGLNGKAVLPMVLGLGCDTMATMSTRILSTRRERLIVALLLALAVPCSAQLAVIFGLFSVAGTPGLLAAWFAIVLGVLVAVGFLAGRLVPGEPSDFIIELPPIRRPGAVNIARKTLARIEWYLREAVPLFMLGTLLLFTLDRLHLLEAIVRGAEPLVSGLLGLPPDCAAAFVVGFIRRDYGAVFLFDAARAGELSPAQVLVATVTITLFLPCVASYFMLIKEFGLRTACAVALYVGVLAFGVGAAVHAVLGP